MRRALVVVATLSLLLVALAQPVAAGSMSFHRSDYHQFQFDWIQVDLDPNGDQWEPENPNRPFGNVHVGFVVTFEIASGVMEVFGQIADLDCPVGILPPAGGHGILEEEPGPDPENPCTHIGFREIQGSVPFTVGSKLTSATLGGPGITVGIFGGGDQHGGGGTLLTNAPIDVVFHGEGPLTKSTFSERWTDGTNSYSSRYASTGRAAELSGLLGPMGFDPDLSGGFISYNKESFRSRSK